MRTVPGLGSSRCWKPVQQRLVDEAGASLAVLFRSIRVVGERVGESQPKPEVTIQRAKVRFKRLELGVRLGRAAARCV